MPDYSRNPIVVEYAVRELFKKRTIRTAAKTTAQKLSGGTNYLIGPGSIFVYQDELERALWDRLAAFAINALKGVREGKERFAILGTLDHFKQADTPQNEKFLTAAIQQKLFRVRARNRFSR